MQMIGLVDPLSQGINKKFFFEVTCPKLYLTSKYLLTNQKLVFDSWANQVLFFQYHIRKRNWGYTRQDNFFIVWLLGFDMEFFLKEKPILTIFPPKLTSYILINLLQILLLVVLPVYMNISSGQEVSNFIPRIIFVNSATWWIFLHM